MGEESSLGSEQIKKHLDESLFNFTFRGCWHASAFVLKDYLRDVGSGDAFV